MNVSKVVISLFLVFCATQSFAYTPQNYLSAVKKRDDGDPVAKLLLSGYRLGIVETVQTIIRLNGKRIELGENAPICVPNSRAINLDSIERAISLVIGTPSNPQNLSTLGNIPVATVAVYGLSKVFPCEE